MMRLIAVDDEQPALDDLIRVLKKAVPDAEIEGFTDVGKALEYVEGHPPDLAFLDIEMNGIDGLELAKRLKELYRYTNIIFVTAYSHYAVEAFSVFASDYLLKPATEQAVLRAMTHLRYPVAQRTETGLRVQAFGNFEVFVNGEILHFPRSKAKELFAYLIHKKGTGCGTREIAAVLFGDEPYTLSLQKQTQTLISTMMRTLRNAGVSDCIIKSYNRTAVDVTKVDCDYYRFLNRDINAINSYAGEYMANYEWAEFVIGYLNNKIL